MNFARVLNVAWVSIFRKQFRNQILMLTLAKVRWMFVEADPSCPIKDVMGRHWRRGGGLAEIACTGKNQEVHEWRDLGAY